MKTNTFLVLALFAAACGGGDDDNTEAPDANEQVPDAGPPAKPALGAQIERMGRPAINTAANHTFDGDAVATQAGKDAYNQADNPAEWGSAFAEEFEFNLGIFDGLDTVCGNQFGAAATLNNERYNLLAGVLADDKLYVNSASGDCTTYLAVEGDALGLSNNDCGGRVMSYDVIKVSYSALAVGNFDALDDNIAAEAVPSDPLTFPFLADPI